MTVNNQAVLTSLPSTANFSTLTVNNNAVLTSVPSSVLQQGSNTLSQNVTFSGNYTIAGATPTELSYVSGVTSALQTQLNSKLTNGATNTLTGM